MSDSPPLDGPLVTPALTDALAETNAELYGMRRYDPGLYLDIDAEEYHHRELGVVNKSALDRITKSPAHYKDWVDEERDDDNESAALTFGRAFHCAVLEPEVFARNYVVAPDFGDGRTKPAKDAKRAFTEANHGREVVTAADAKVIAEMTASITRHPLARQLLRGGVAEATLRWDDAETDLPCKARSDYYIESLASCIDLKTTLDASPKEFAKSCASYRYHVQAAHYSAGFAAIGKPIEAFVFIAVEKTSPYAVATYVLSSEDQQKGNAAYRADLQHFADAMNSGEFSAYGDGILEINLPRWAA